MIHSAKESHVDLLLFLDCNSGPLRDPASGRMIRGLLTFAKVSRVNEATSSLVVIYPQQKDRSTILKRQTVHLQVLQPGNAFETKKKKKG